MISPHYASSVNLTLGIDINPSERRAGNIVSSQLGQFANGQFNKETSPQTHKHALKQYTIRATKETTSKEEEEEEQVKTTKQKQTTDAKPSIQ